MGTMKIIDLLNKIANGEETPKKIRIDHWCYKFEWKKEVNQYWDDASELSLEDVLSLDNEELNYGVQILEDEEEFEDIEEINIKTFPKHNNSLRKTADKVNQLIRNQKKIIERLNNDSNK